MDALQNALEDVNRQIDAIIQYWREFQETTGSRLNAAQTRLRADQLRPLRTRKTQLENDIANFVPGPREAPERGRASREAGRARPIATGTATTSSADGRGDQIEDVLTRVYEGRRRQIAQSQLYRETRAVWERENRQGTGPTMKEVIKFLKTDDLSQLQAPLPKWGGRPILVSPLVTELILISLTGLKMKKAKGKQAHIMFS